MKRLRITAFLLAALIAHAAWAHETRPAYLEFKQTGEQTFDVTWKVPARGHTRLDLDLHLPDDCINTTAPRGRFADSAHTQQWTIKHPTALAGRTISVDGLQTTLTDVLVRIERLDGTTQVLRLMPASPSFTLEAAPDTWQISWTYLVLGIEHILLGIDHLLFVLGLLLLVDRKWMLVKTITAFTIAHSITLALSVFAVIRVPAAPLNACIALSILFLGPEIVRKWRGQTSLTIRQPWLVAFVFGLLHGVGFASGLSMTGLPRAEIPMALLLFNVGVEIGQLAFVLLAIAVAWAARTLALDRPAWVSRIPAYTVGSLGAFWTIQRVLIMFE